MSRRLIATLAGLAIVGGMGITPPAWAAPPPNDNRADAIRLNLPAEITGTLVEATMEQNEAPQCGSTDASVWYRFQAPASGAVIIQFDAAGEMDSSLGLFHQVRSRFDTLDCEVTDTTGAITIDNAQLKAGDSYFLRVGKLIGSEANTFSMKVLVPSPAPTPPGKPLPASGAKGKVDRLLNTGDAYWMRLREGRTMRVSLRVRQCTQLEIYAPGTRSFDDVAEVSRRCGGFTLFTPTQTGRYVFLVSAGRSRTAQKYSLRVAAAGRDDTAPGVFIRNNATVTGRVNGGIDSRDLFRFDVARRSRLQLWVKGGPELRLMRDDGRRWYRTDSYDLVLRPGRFYVAVEGQGKYTLRRISKTITRTVVRFNGKRRATVSPGGSVQMALGVTPRVSGPGVLELERFDPVDGWQFVRRYRLNVVNGSARASFVPQVGRYRISGEFKGTLIAGDSASSYAVLKVQNPLTD